MADDPAFLFYAGDYLRDTQCLSEKSQVAYDRIMCEHMRNICISQKQLKFFTKRLSDDEIEELMMVLRQTKDGFQIAWVADSIAKRRAYSDSRRNNRKGKTKKNTSSSYVNHMENEIEYDNEIENQRKKESVQIGIDFETFFTAYGKQIDQIPCQREWSNIDRAEHAKILVHVPKYVAATPDVQFRKKPLNYLKDRTWLDPQLPNHGSEKNNIPKDFSNVEYP